MSTITLPRHERILGSRTTRPAARSRPADAIYRAAHAALATRAGTRAPALDEGASTVLRAATSALTLGSDGAAIVATAAADFIADLGPASAGAQLMADALNLDLGRNAAIRIPGMITSAIAGIVAEGAPIPAASLSLTGPTLQPVKLATIIAFTGETLKRTSAEAVVRTALRESAALSLDAELFSTTAPATGEHPGGLLHDATTVTPATGGGEAAMTRDLAALAAAVAPVGGTSIAFVASPAQAVAIAVSAPAFAFPVFAASTLAAGTVAAVATNALAFAVTGSPEFDVSKESTLHMDTDPAQISTAGSPPTVAAPVVSTFQADLFALRMMLDVAWTKRAPGAVSVVSEVTW